MKPEPRFVHVSADDAGLVLDLVESVYRGFEDINLDTLKAIISAAEASIAAIVNGEAVAFATASRLPGVFEVRNLAVDPRYPGVLTRFVAKLVSSAEPGPPSGLIRVSALGVPSIVRAVSGLGLKPQRRILKVKWRLGSPVKCGNRAASEVSVIRVEDVEQAESVARAYLDGLRTHWSWCIEADEGGYEAALAEVVRWIRGNPSRWFAALAGGQVAGAAGYAPHPRRAETAWLASVAVRPEYRLRGVGRALLCAVLNAARCEGFTEAVVYTYSPMAGLAPGATLYLKSGGLIQAEYIHFERRLSDVGALRNLAP